jgi:hypothetical protein
VSFLYANLGNSKGGENMAKDDSNGGGGYKIPSTGQGMIKAPNTIIKNQTTPKKTTGGDLRSK